MKVLLILYVISSSNGETISREVVGTFESVETCAAAQAETGFHLPSNGRLTVYQCEQPLTVGT